MKTLVLIRHAKSSWKNPDLKDVERPLKKRGLKDAPLIARVLKELPITPDCILSSQAERALTTANLVANEYGMDDSMIQSRPGLYLEPASRLLQEIHAISEEYNVVFLVGHNPGLMDLADSLTGESLDKFPTSGAFGIEFHCDTWQEAGMENAKKIFFESPKKHRKSTKAKNTQEKNANGKSSNGKSANGKSSNGRSANGKSPNGKRISGKSTQEQLVADNHAADMPAKDINVSGKPAEETHADGTLTQQQNEPGL